MHTNLPGHSQLNLWTRQVCRAWFQRRWKLPRSSLYQSVHNKHQISGLPTYLWIKLQVATDQYQLREECDQNSNMHLISMRQMTTMRKIQSHDALMRLQKSCVCLKIGWWSRKGLHVYCCQSTFRKFRIQPNSQLNNYITCLCPSQNIPSTFINYYNKDCGMGIKIIWPPHFSGSRRKAASARFWQSVSAMSMNLSQRKLPRN